MSENITTPLGELLQTIIDYRGKTPPKSPKGIPTLTAANVKSGRIDLSKISYVSNETYEKWTTRGFPNAGDVLITTEAPVGEVAPFPGDQTYLITRRVIALRGKEDILDNNYLLYLLQSQKYKNKLLEKARGSTVPRVLKTDITGLEIPLLPIEEQKKIAEIFTSIDHKIELNRQTNQTLEQIAQAIFKSWFVDFDPTRAKIQAKQNGQDPERAAMAAISGKTLQQLEQLNPQQLQQLQDTAALFPDALVESELGEIPEGWEAGSLSKIATFSNKRTDVSKLTVTNYISTENMLENKAGIREAASLPNVKTVPLFGIGDILISNIRPYFKKIWLAQFEGGRSNDVLGFVSVAAGCTEYVYNLLYQDSFFAHMMTTSKGAKMPRGDKDAIMKWRIVIPVIELRKLFSDQVKHYYDFIQNYRCEISNLESIRNTVLPKIFSGELNLGSHQKDLEPTT